MIIAEIKMGVDYTTQVTGKTIEEIIEKIKSFHTISDFEREHYRKKGSLTKILKSGWYLKDAK